MDDHIKLITNELLDLDTYLGSLLNLVLMIKRVNIILELLALFLRRLWNSLQHRMNLFTMVLEI